MKLTLPKAGQQWTENNYNGARTVSAQTKYPTRIEFLIGNLSGFAIKNFFNLVMYCGLKRVK